MNSVIFTSKQLFIWIFLLGNSIPSHPQWQYLQSNHIPDTPADIANIAEKYTKLVQKRLFFRAVHIHWATETSRTVTQQPLSSLLVANTQNLFIVNTKKWFLNEFFIPSQIRLHLPRIQAEVCPATDETTSARRAQPKPWLWMKLHQVVLLLQPLGPVLQQLSS